MIKIITESMEIHEGKRVGAVIPDMEYSQITNLVKRGMYLNDSDFVREAIRDKLKTVKEINLRDISYSQQKKKLWIIVRKEIKFHYLI